MDLQQVGMKAPTIKVRGLFTRFAEQCRRLHSSLNAKRMADRLRALDRQIEVLREQMTIDDQLAENNRRLYLKSPVLQSRREEDRRYMAQLVATREILRGSLAAPQ